MVLFIWRSGSAKLGSGPITRTYLEEEEEEDSI
jgi:hypothetical protein